MRLKPFLWVFFHAPGIMKILGKRGIKNKKEKNGWITKKPFPISREYLLSIARDQLCIIYIYIWIWYLIFHLKILSLKENNKRHLEKIKTTTFVRHNSNQISIKEVNLFERKVFFFDNINNMTIYYLIRIIFL